MPGKIVSQNEWVAQRKGLLVKEKEALRVNDALNAQLREFPMVRLDKHYTFETPSGKATLADLFDGRKQLIVYHFMLAPDQNEGCTGCSFLADHIPDLSHLRSRDTSFVVVSRAPLAKIEAFKRRMGWTFPWVSSFGSEFNYDFHVSLDGDVAPVEYNYKDKATLEKEGKTFMTKGELPGLSVFYREDKDIFHTYSTYARGLEGILGTNWMLDKTVLGRQDSSTSDWLHHDKYIEK